MHLWALLSEHSYCPCLRAFPLLCIVKFIPSSSNIYLWGDYMTELINIPSNFSCHHFNVSTYGELVMGADYLWASSGNISKLGGMWIHGSKWIVNVRSIFRCSKHYYPLAEGQKGITHVRLREPFASRYLRFGQEGQFTVNLHRP